MKNEKTTLDVSQALPQFYLPYAQYVLATRALPDARDGLKSGARFILFAQYLKKLNYKNPTKKAGETVSAAMRFNVHGDASIYGNAVRLSQAFSLRYPVIDVQGNNGSIIYGEDYSAMRYLEMRGNQIAYDMTRLLPKETIDDWRWNYSQEEKYPTILPTLFPFSLVNGSSGIGVGCSSSIPQFNLNEVCDALIKLIDDPDCVFEDIYCPIDFATGGTIINENQVKESLKYGHGRAASIRATIQHDNELNELIITEIPYQTYTSTIVSQIQEAIEKGHLVGVDNVFDGTDAECKPYEAKICVKLIRGANVEKIVKELFKYTSLQSHYSINMMMLKDGRFPVRYTWKMMMETYLEHLESVLKKSYEYELKQIKSKINILSGYLIAIANIDEIVQIIKQSENHQAAARSLIKRFEFNAEQAEAILDLKLNRLVGLEAIKIKSELEELTIKGLYFESLLTDKVKFQAELKSEIQTIKKNYGDERRTRNMNLILVDDKEDVEPVEKKSLYFHLTNKNNLYVVESSTLITQRRGSKGFKLKLDNNETVVSSIASDNYGTLVFFSNKGNMYNIYIQNLPLGLTSINTLFTLGEDEQITNFISLDKTDKKYIYFITKLGMIKKSKLDEYQVKRNRASQAIKLKDSDEIIKVLIGNDEPIGVITNEGHFLKLDVSLINPIGRIASGVKTAKLREDEYLADAVILNKTDKYLIILTSQGFAKRIDIENLDYTTRGNRGASFYKLGESDIVVSMLPVDGNATEVTIITLINILKIPISDIPILSTAAQGTKAIKLNTSNKALKVIKE
jgi:DNA gyrase subunit A